MSGSLLVGAATGWRQVAVEGKIVQPPGWDSRRDRRYRRKCEAQAAVCDVAVVAEVPLRFLSAGGEV